MANDYTGLVQNLYQTYDGRQGEQAGVDWWSQQIQNGAMTPTHAVASFAATPEAQNAFYNDWGVYQNQARQAAAGINSMPYVYGNYSLPAMSGQSIESILYPNGAGDILPQLKGLLTFGPELSQPVVPSLSSLSEEKTARPAPSGMGQGGPGHETRPEFQKRIKQ